MPHRATLIAILKAIPIIAGAAILYALVLWAIDPWLGPDWRPFIPGLVSGAGSVLVIVLVNLWLRRRHTGLNSE